LTTTNSNLRKSLLSIYIAFSKIFSGHGFGNLKPIRFINAFVVSNLKPDYVEIEGNIIYLDRVDSLHLATAPEYEVSITPIIKRELRKGSVVLDIGANIGYYTLMFARIVGSAGKVYAFEPDPDNFELLKKNVEKNGYRNVVLENKAVSNVTGKARLYLSEKDKGDHRLCDSLDGRKSIEVDVISMDDYFKESMIKIDFAKIDVQGSEYGAIQGMSKVIELNPGFKMVIEYEPDLLRHFGIEPMQYFDLLRAEGLDIYSIDMERGSLESLDRASFFSMKAGNFFCIKR